MRVLGVCIFVCAIALCTGRADAAQAAAPVDPEKGQLIRQFLDMTHAADQIVVAIEASIPVQRAANPRIPAVFWDRFLAQARERRGELVDGIVAVYSRSFNADELRGLLQFYGSPLGKRLIEVQPTLLRESSQVGQQWGQRIGVEIGQKLAAEGVKIEP